MTADVDGLTEIPRERVLPTDASDLVLIVQIRDQELPIATRDEISGDELNRSRQVDALGPS